MSHEDYEHLNKFKWHRTQYGYVQGHINNKNWFIHRYVYYLQNVDITNKIIDHIDRNKLNNTSKNLRIVSLSENNHNRTVAQNISSKYLGVCWSNRDNIWRVQKKITSKFILTCSFKDEKHAAHQYDIWCKEYNIYTSNLNNIDSIYLETFIPYVKKDKKTDNKINKIPKGIVYYNDYYIIEYKNKKYWCKSLQEAIIYFNLKHEERIINIKIQEENRLNTPIKMNANNIAIIELFNNKKKKICDTLIDTTYYYEITKYKWRVTKKYVYTDIDNKACSLHKFIFEKLLKINIGTLIIDHINNNSLDNRIENLRLVTFSDNAHNRGKLENTSSKYIGVFWDKDRNKWVSQINNNGKHYNLGRFDKELDAAKKRDDFVIKNNLLAKLNFPLNVLH